jgi:hypothetical protein
VSRLIEVEITGIAGERLQAAAYRLDIRKRLQGIANEMHLLQATSVALISDQVVEQSGEWSEPLQCRIIREKDGIVEIQMRVPE